MKLLEKRMGQHTDGGEQVGQKTYIHSARAEREDAPA